MPSDVPPEVDTSRPSVARMYDAVLGGKDHYEVDRTLLRALLDIDPNVLLGPRDNREWQVRITRYLAEEVGIEQFLDLGSGLPTAENTHQVAQRINPDAAVVYVDNDPVVGAHGRALLADNEQTRFVLADLMNPAEVLSNAVVSRFLDFSEPIALFQTATLHHYPDAEELRKIMRRYTDALVPGSYVAISHFHDPGGPDGEVAKRFERLLVDGALGSGYFRTGDEIASFFPPGVDPVEPGLVAPSDWWPDGPRTAEQVTPQRLYLAGLARKS